MLCVLVDRGEFNLGGGEGTQFRPWTVHLIPPSPLPCLFVPHLGPRAPLAPRHRHARRASVCYGSRLPRLPRCGFPRPRLQSWHYLPNQSRGIFFYPFPYKIHPSHGQWHRIQRRFAPRCRIPMDRLCYLAMHNLPHLTCPSFCNALLPRDRLPAEIHLTFEHIAYGRPRSLRALCLQERLPSRLSERTDSRGLRLPWDLCQPRYGRCFCQCFWLHCPYACHLVSVSQGNRRCRHDSTLEDSSTHPRFIHDMVSTLFQKNSELIPAPLTSRNRPSGILSLAARIHPPRPLSQQYRLRCRMNRNCSIFHPPHLVVRVSRGFNCVVSDGIHEMWIL